MEFEGENIEMIPVQRPKTPYLILERVYYDKVKDDRAIILIGIEKLGPSEIKLGRGHECDLRENDISASRLHAMIKLTDDGFSIVDNNSKFGTLVLLRNNLKLDNKKVGLQIGRNVLTFTVTTKALPIEYIGNSENSG